METDSIIFITGSRGMVGRVLVEELKSQGYNNLLLPSSEELNLKDQSKLDNYFNINEIDYVFHLAAKVGGIAANLSAPAEFLYDNLMIECNVIEAARKHGVKKLLFLGSSCVYPRNSLQPMKEEYLLSSNPEPTNEGYALSKICGIKLCEFYNKQYGTNFICLVPPNLYGPYDHYEPKNSHVISALIYKYSMAKLEKRPFVEIWGSGECRREFLFVEDLVDAIMFFFKNYESNQQSPFLNIGSGTDISVKQLAYLIKNVVGYEGEICFDKTKPDGMPQKLMDNSKAKELGWVPKVELIEGIQRSYEWFIKNEKNHIYN